MSAACPNCGGRLRNGACFKCGYRSPNSTMTKAKPEWQSRDGTSPAPLPPSSAERGGSDGAGPPSPAPSAAPFPPAPETAVVGPPWSSAPAAPQPSWRGGLTVRGTIIEVGEPRFESVSNAGNQAAERLARGCLTAPFRAAGIMIAVLFAPFRMLLGPSLAPGRRPNGPDRTEVPGHPFLVQADVGAEYDCYLRGELRGGFLRMGDPVEVAGRLDRDHVLRVSRVRNLRTGSLSRGYVDPKARYATVRGAIAVLLVLFVIYLLASVYQ